MERIIDDMMTVICLKMNCIDIFSLLCTCTRLYKLQQDIANEKYQLLYYNLFKYRSHYKINNLKDCIRMEIKIGFYKNKRCICCFKSTPHTYNAM